MTRKRYEKILLATDFFEGCSCVSDAAKDLADLYNAQLSIVHVNESPMNETTVHILGWDTVLSELKAAALADKKKRLSELASDLGISEENVFMLEGRPANQIHDLCEKLHSDLIVIGTHGQNGLSLLLGSTASSVLHGSNCDVLAVRIGWS